MYSEKLAIAKGMDRSTVAGRINLTSAQMSATGVFLLFAAGTRPCSEAVTRFVASRQDIMISHRPADVATEAAGAGDRAGWLEILKDGLTFDLCGLSPAANPNMPEISNFFDFSDTYDYAFGYSGLSKR